MADDEQVFDSPTSWAADHARRYLETDGADGHEWRGAPTLLLTTRGRRSGQLRRTPLIYGRDGDAYLLVASQGGRPTHPLWYLNLTTDPDVRIQVGADHVTARARTATDEEKPRLWAIMAAIWPDYNEYQKKTDRQIPVVVLEPVRG